MNEIECMERMMKMLTNIMIALDEDGHHKSGEPSIKIGLTNDDVWWGEIYSYVFDFDDGGRTHHFEAECYECLIRKMIDAIEYYVVGEIIDDIEREREGGWDD